MSGGLNISNMITMPVSGNPDARLAVDVTMAGDFSPRQLRCECLSFVPATPILGVANPPNDHHCLLGATQ